MFKNKINPDHISYKCTLKWDDLKDSKEGKYCNHCQENVFDLRDCSLEDVIQLQKKKGMVCGLVSTLAISSLLSTNSCAPLTQTMGTICPPQTLERVQVIQAVPVAVIDRCGKNIVRPLEYWSVIGLKK